MNKKITKLMAALALLLFMTPAMVGWGQTRSEVAAYTFATEQNSSNTAYASNYNITVSGVQWSCPGNQNFSGYVRIGGKSLSGVDRQIYSKEKIDTQNPYTVTKITVNHNGISNANLTVNSAKIVVANDASFNNTVETITLNPTFSVSTSGSFDFTPTQTWNSELYYKFIFNLSNSKSSNYGLDLTSIVFYKEEGDTPQPTTYTVTFDAGDGTFVGSTDFPNASNTVEAGTYTLPSATPATGYTFDGWTAAGISTPITGSYTVSSNIEFTAQYTQNSGSGTVTATLTQSNLELTGSYSSNTSKTIDGITYVHTDLMKSNSNIQAKASTGTIKNTTAYPGDITSVAITHSGTARATTINGSADGTNWTQVATGSGSITADFSGRGYKYFQITRGSNAAYWEKIDITYSTTSSSLTDSDLAITNASTTLSFDLYNNSAAQTITYTTSSTGSITITPASPTEYFSYVHDATAKTITVTPTAVTPSAQTVTINQAADDDYYAGSASFTVSIANSNPNVPGTVNNPYTVAQARAAIDANTGITGVYATGIVSQVDSYNSNYHSITYWISDDGTTTNQLEAYGGISGITGWTFASKDDIEVGATVVIYGNLKKYNSTYEFDVNNELVSYTAPQHAVEAPTFSPAAGTFTMAQTVTLSCATTGATIYYTLNGTEPTDSSTEYTNAIAVSTTTTIKAIAYVGSEASTVATATYHINSQDNPYTVAQALAFNEYPANGIYVHGIVSTAPTQSPTNNGELTYYISVDGEAANQLEVYKGKGLNQVAFTAQDDIQVGDIVTVYGNVVIYNGTKEFSSGNYLVSFERPAQQYTLTVTCSENVEIFTFVDPNEQGVEGATTQQVTSGTEVGISVSVPEGYVLTLMVDGQNVTSDLDDTGYYTFSMPAHDVVVIATAVEDVPPTTGDYVRITSLEQLTNGCKVVVASRYNTTATNYFAMKNTIGQKIQGTEFESQTSGNNEILASAIADDIDSYYWTVSIIGNEYTFTNPSGDKVGYGSNTNFTTNGDNTAWSIARGTSPQALVEYYKGFTITNVKTDTRGIALRDSDGNKAFGAYATSNANGNTYNFYLDFFVQGAETPAPETHTKSIAGWDVGEEENAFNFYLIASPIGDVDPTSVTITSEDPDVPTGVTNMVSGDFDLYYFDHNRDKEWVNYKQPVEGETSGFNPGFNVLETGKGYLYANKYDVTLVFTGTGITSGEQTIPLDYHAEGDGFTIDLPGWNLVGNPFAVNAWLVDNPGFYTMDPDGYYQAVTNANGVINAMEGVFVVATEEGQSVTFTTTEPGSKGAMLALNLSNGRKVIDRAIVRFDGGRQLPKLQFRQGSTKVYIPVEGQDYAIVSGEEMGEMPVSFTAEKNGSYNLSLSSEEVSFAYLHLIDNMTGADVDLLQTPSYSFEAKTTDYENRFKLVFATGDNSNDDNFAFFSNGSFVINNEGNAELQVIDVTGRIVKSESINGCTNVNVNAASGVYMLRLINGDNVKVQKVVVK